jgi:hypothetical protein
VAGAEIQHTGVMTNRRQLGYLAVLLIAIAIVPAGLVALWSYPIVGVVLILSALALSIQTGVELYRIRRSEFCREFLMELRLFFTGRNRGLLSSLLCGLTPGPRARPETSHDQHPGEARSKIGYTAFHKGCKSSSTM